MNLFENTRIALRALAANKLRASLTMLGILIGVAAVITLVSIGDGVTRFVADQFIGLGTNLVFVLPAGEFGPPGTGSGINELAAADADLLADPVIVQGAVSVVPVINRGADLQYDGTVYRSRAVASRPAYAGMRGYEVARGRMFNDSEYAGRSRVAVLGQDVVAALFPEDIDPLDQDIRIRGINFRVIGLLESQGGGAFGSQDDLVLVPLTTAQERLYNLRSQRTGDQLVDLILIQAVDSDVIGNIIIETSDALRQAHAINFRDEDDFLILTQQDFLDSFSAVTNVLTLFLGAIASISLLVGGIGIMNIMLVSVTERTREIGLRKAVGAKRRDILGQFLTEAIILSLLGGLLGLLLGVAGASAVRLAVPELDTTVTVDSISLAVGFSAGVGLFFGIYPAFRAAQLSPIEALRFE